VRLEVVDVVGAVSWIINKGCDREHRIKDGHLFDQALNCPLDPRDIHIDTALRLESRPNAGDASDVYAILDQKTHGKGLLIDIFDEICDRGLAERLSCDGREVIGISTTAPIFEAIEGARAARPWSSTEGRL
jgi:hypothetical protein